MRTAPLLLSIACLMTATAVAQQPPDESAATVRRLHETMMKPASDVIFNVGREAPKNNEDWIAISGAGVTLVSAGNLLMRASPPKDGAKWIALSRQLVTAGRAARKAAEARNVGALMRTSDRLILVCETCHARYRNPSCAGGVSADCGDATSA